MGVLSGTMESTFGLESPVSSCISLVDDIGVERGVSRDVESVGNGVDEGECGVIGNVVVGSGCTGSGFTICVVVSV